MRRRGWLTAMPGLLAALGGCETGPRRLATLGGLTGRAADLGVGGRDGVQLALEQAGDGRWVLDSYDDQQEPEPARAALRSAHAAGHALVVGPMTSSIAVALAPLAAELDMLLLSPTVTTNELSGRADAFFRIVSSVEHYARASAEYHAGRVGLRRFAIVRDDGNRSYTQTWAAEFAAEVRRRGGAVVDEQVYVFSAALQMPALAHQALASRPDAVLLVCNALDAARLAQALRKAAPTLPLITSEWAATDQFLALGGAAVEGITVTRFLDPDSRRPAYLAFVQAYAKRFGRTPGFAACAGYDAATVAMRALRSRRRGESLARTLLRLRRFEGLQQTLSFDDDGDAVHAVYLTRVTGGRFVRVQ